MKCFFASTAAIAILAVIGGILFIYSGVYDVRSTRPDPRLERWALHTTMLKSTARASRKLPRPSAHSLDNLERIGIGLNQYDAMCINCHGAPGIQPESTGFVLNPRPPELSAVAGKMAPRTLFWIVKNGIKMTGMPAWGKVLPDGKIWDIVAFLRQLPGMTPKKYVQLIRHVAMAERKGATASH